MLFYRPVNNLIDHPTFASYVYFQTVTQSLMHAAFMVKRWVLNNLDTGKANHDVVTANVH
jgi:hypothetical protein